MDLVKVHDVIVIPRFLAFLVAENPFEMMLAPCLFSDLEEIREQVHLPELARKVWVPENMYKVS